MKVDGLQSSIIFGPVDSRRYGRSLGINLLPASIKVCSFNCPYCECGQTDAAVSRKPDVSLFPPANLVAAVVEDALARIAGNDASRGIDTITLAGNGEPTLHPGFPAVMKALAAARDQISPRTRLVALTNGSTLKNERVREGLMIADERIVKFDAATDEMLRRVNSPICRLTVDEIVEGIGLLPTCVVQTMFVRGKVDNSLEDHVREWVRRIGQIRPHHVQVYSIDRRPADPEIRRVDPGRLYEITDALMSATGVPATVYS